MTSSFARHSRFSDPGALAPWLADVEPDIGRLHAVASGLVFHYWAHGDVTAHGFGPGRFGEINLRYADTMFARLRELNPAPLSEPREPTERLVGCCRDFTLVLLALARQHGIPARTRVGFADYLIPGWRMDHVVAELWDGARWRLVEPTLAEHDDIDLLDVPRDRFLVGADAWAACRSGDLDPQQCVVAPELTQPYLRGWPYLAHHLVHDLATLNKHEMLLWDLWGAIGYDRRGQPRDHARLDALAESLRSGDDERVAAEFADPDFHVPDVVTSVTPPGLQPETVTLRPA
jgi:hypothetical protein